jgi:RNA polymerase-binding transcription factor DksA
MSISYFSNFKEAADFAKTNSNKSNKVKLKRKGEQFEVEIFTELNIQPKNQKNESSDEVNNSESLCIDCGIIIPEERVKKINANRCIKCQTEYEKTHDTRPKVNEGLSGSREDNKKMRGQIYGGIKSRNAGN